jgi:predicted pyridoxine 5'-phosphate oxidase superfamily flavin-nucleotide-binding protein
MSELKLDDKMQTMLSTQTPILATVIQNSGLPNIGPKRSLRVYDGNHLIYNENTGGQTLENIEKGSKVAIAVIDRPNLDGYRFVGTPRIYHDGEAFDNALAFAAENGMKEPKCAVLIQVDEVYTLKSGPTAGQKLT